MTFDVYIFLLNGVAYLNFSTLLNASRGVAASLVQVSRILRPNDSSVKLKRKNSLKSGLIPNPLEWSEVQIHQFSVWVLLVWFGLV